MMALAEVPRLSELTRFIVNDTDYFLSQPALEYFMRAWERSPHPPKGRPMLTKRGFEHARQQLLLEKLRARRS